MFHPDYKAMVCCYIINLEQFASQLQEKQRSPQRQLCAAEHEGQALQSRWPRPARRGPETVRVEAEDESEEREFREGQMFQMWRGRPLGEAV